MSSPRYSLRVKVFAVINLSACVFLLYLFPPAAVPSAILGAAVDVWVRTAQKTNLPEDAAGPRPMLPAHVLGLPLNRDGRYGSFLAVWAGAADRGAFRLAQRRTRRPDPIAVMRRSVVHRNLV